MLKLHGQIISPKLRYIVGFEANNNRNLYENTGTENAKQLNVK